MVPRPNIIVMTIICLPNYLSRDVATVHPNHRNKKFHMIYSVGVLQVGVRWVVKYHRAYWKIEEQNNSILMW